MHTTEKAPSNEDAFFLLYYAARLFLLASEALVSEAGETCTYERSYDEEPEVRHCAEVLREECLRDGASRVDRSVGQRNRYEVDEGKSKTDSEACKLTILMLAVGSTEDYHQENEGEHTLDSECATYVYVKITVAEDVSTPCVSSKEAGFLTASGIDTEEDSSSSDSAYYLCAPVCEHLLAGHAAVSPYAERYSRVEMCAGDMADAISHCYYGETEGDSYAEETYTTEQSGTTTAENEYESAKALCTKFLTKFHDCNVLMG